MGRWSRLGRGHTRYLGSKFCLRLPHSVRFREIRLSYAQVVNATTFAELANFEALFPISPPFFVCRWAPLPASPVSPGGIDRGFDQRFHVAGPETQGV